MGGGRYQRRGELLPGSRRILTASLWRSARHRARPLRFGSKIAVTVALFALALNWLELVLAPTILAYIATLLVYFAALGWPRLSGTNDG